MRNHVTLPASPRATTCPHGGKIVPEALFVTQLSHRFSVQYRLYLINFKIKIDSLRLFLESFASLSSVPPIYQNLR